MTAPVSIFRRPTSGSFVLDLRDRFVVPPAPAAELRAFTHGLMPRTVPDLMATFTTDWAERGVDAWNHVPDRWDLGHPSSWWSLPEDLGDRWIAPLLGAPRGTCIHQPNVHWTIQALLSCDEPFSEGRNEVVLTANEFPSVRHSVQRWVGLRDLRPVEIPASSRGFVDVEGLLDAITDRTAWVFVSHVGFTTGERLTDETLRAIIDRAHHHGAFVCVDGYHATASLPIHAATLGVDVYVGGLLKEACGSTGNSYLYVREELDLRPRLAGWFSDADPFGFNDTPADHPTVRRRFLAGTTNIASMYHAVEGLRVLLDVGIDAVRADSLAKTALAIERADALGLSIRSPRVPDYRGAMVILEVQAADRLCAWLKTQGIYTDSRQGRVLRMAPFVWNPIEDVDRAFEAIREALTSGAYKTAALPAEGGPVT